MFLLCNLHILLTAELRRAEHHGYQILRNLSMRESLVMTSAYTQTVGVEVGRKDGLWDGDVRANFLGGKSRGQHCIWQAEFFWREITLTVVGLHAQSKPV